MAGGGVASAADLISQMGDQRGGVAGSAPLGRRADDPNPMVPANYRGQKAVIYARNWSAVRKRRVIIDPVSFARGGEDIQADLAKKGQGVSLDKLHEKALDFRVDLDKTEERLMAAVFMVTFDGKQYPVPPHGIDAITHEECDAPHVIMPEGAWDLHCGNFDMLKYGTPKDRENEMVRMVSKWGRYNRVFSADTPLGSPGTKYAYVEFIREPIPEAAVAVDTERLYPGQLVEV